MIGKHALQFMSRGSRSASTACNGLSGLIQQHISTFAVQFQDVNGPQLVVHNSHGPCNIDNVQNNYCPS